MKKISLVLVICCIMIGICGCNMQCALGHTPGEWIIDSTSSRTQAGTRHQVCAACGETIRELTDSTGLTYKRNGGDGTCMISGIGTCTDTQLVIPESFDGRKVIGIGDKAFAKCGELTSIVLPDTIVSIGSNAFANCSKLENINLPQGDTLKR